MNRGFSARVLRRGWGVTIHLFVRQHRVNRLHGGPGRSRQQGGLYARSIERANYPIAIDVMPGKNLSVEITYDLRRFDAAEVAHTLRNFELLLDSFVAHPDITLRTLEEILNACDRQAQSAREQNRHESIRQKIRTMKRKAV